MTDFSKTAIDFSNMKGMNWWCQIKIILKKQAACYEVFILCPTS